ncbi:MAG: hypothetical protein LBR66_01065 [Candidatus Symbiothrix sp.]|jgi:hypothetical protein|nr:hypothetical protein [Candidatus Symbiothrix sp.]
MLLIPALQTKNTPIDEVATLLNANKVPVIDIAQVNWKDYLYQPKVSCRIAHNGNNIFLHYEVEEEDVQAVCNTDNGKIWEDSCVEFFLSFADDDFYYNIECNCIGKILMATGSDRHNRTPLPVETLQDIQRFSTLGDSVVSGRKGRWALSLIIPRTVFIRNRLSSFCGLRARGNFYKCGDKLRTPHFLSWCPIASVQPDFHLPAFFGKIQFE